ncbi:hypothetical protein FRC17_010869 [Serendipita sp. 399]|nr:hypothetical protein FRC17_010869 [Serendipita sp. 399]
MGDDIHAGEGVAYLKDVVWWTGMIMMIAGEIMNFGAYAFVEAIVVTPLGALSVVICAIMSSWFLGEKLTTLGWLACAECIFGSVIIALNAPHSPAVATISDFKKIFLAPWFLVWASLCVVTCFVMIFFAAPRFGERSMLIYITICSLFGGLSVSCIQGLGASILTTIRGENQFKNWFIYFLIIFVITTLLAEIFYLNKALALFNTAMVTPTYYVTFTFCVIVTSTDPEKAIENPGIDALRGFGTTLGTIHRNRRLTVYDENGHIVRRGTIYSHRGGSGSARNSPVEMRRRLASNTSNIHITPSTPNVTANGGHVTFPAMAPPSIKEKRDEEEEPTMSALLRREDLVSSPEPMSSQHGLLRLGQRSFKKSAPTASTQQPVAPPETQRPMSLPDMKDNTLQIAEKNTSLDAQNAPQ